MIEEQNIPEENIKAESKKQEEKEICETATPVFSSEQLQPENLNIMEVHHHGHVHEKKKWKEYLFQFVMLFLAITLGFFVENQREHYIERLRAKEFAVQLITGLRQDTTHLNDIIAFNERKEQAYDSMFFYLAQAESPDKWSGIYRHINVIEQRRRFNVTQSVFEQIRNTGGLRYFGSHDIVLKLIDHKKRSDIIEVQDNIDYEYIYKVVIPFVSKHFERNLLSERFNSHIRKEGWDSLQIGTKTPGKFLNTYPGLMIEFENIVIKSREIYFLPASTKVLHKKKTEELIQLLKTEYHLK